MRPVRPRAMLSSHTYRLKTAHETQTRSETNARIIVAKTRCPLVEKLSMENKSNWSTRPTHVTAAKFTYSRARLAVLPRVNIKYCLQLMKF